MKCKVSELEGALLDAAVAKAEGADVVSRVGQPAFELTFDPEGPAHEFSLDQGLMWRHFKPSSEWSDAGPIIERELIDLLHWKDGWRASHGASDGGFGFDSQTPLVSAMRAYVASKFGEEVDL